MLLAELCGKEIRQEKVEFAIEDGRLASKVLSVFILLLFSLLSFACLLFSFLILCHQIRPERVVL